MYAVRFLRLITTRASLSSVNVSSVYSQSRALYVGRFEPSINTWVNNLKPQVYSSISKFQNRFDVRKFHQQFSKLKNPGGNFTMCNAVGLSALLGSVSIWPRTAYAVGGFDALLDDDHLGLLANTKSKNDYQTFLVFLKKLLVPIFLALTIFLNWGHPLIIAAKVTLILYTTKPSPLSIYLFVEELRNQEIQKHPFIYKFKSLHANKVDVEDYAIFCLAKVELTDQKFTVVGILGSWWVLPVSSWQEGVSVLNYRFSNILS
ncbi:PREDICTED: uncharacterized protein LOC109178101 [Ipomoea nil]|uniref:uncharacterized protein LOC109178101 n=1 Tax=Ipomoea nil TaxID=35883 RepID=UPI0009013D4A|nr:PREDICTED: uncharacterized protein LOC109178101 [Ipomoea nil]